MGKLILLTLVFHERNIQHLKPTNNTQCSRQYHMRILAIMIHIITEEKKDWKKTSSSIQVTGD
jgi:hypothetical protein